MVLLFICASLTVTTMQTLYVYGILFHFITERSQVTSQNAAGLYYLSGLIHISEVSWDVVQDARDFLREGDEVRVKVIAIDK